MFCKRCGKEIYDEAVICPNCGCDTGKNVAPPYVPSGDDEASGGLIDFLKFVGEHLHFDGEK